MKGNRKRNLWPALWLVVLAAAVLAGCPHNNMLDNGGGAGAGSGSRGGSGGVQLIITNFVDGGPVASRSALSGSMRTIVPEHIDLTVDAEINKHVFVAYATGNGTWGPEFIDIAPGTGAAFLEGLGTGTWEVTVEAYDVELLKTPLGVATRDEVLAKTPADVTAQKNVALVLSGGATVDTNRGHQVTLALTGDTVEGDGTVDVAVYFTTDTDVKAIFKTDSEYKVTAQLVSQATGQPVQDTEVVLWQDATTPAGVVKIDTDPNAPFTYRKYDPADPAKYKDETITTTMAQKKVLAYKPTAQGQPLQIPKGRYLLRVTVENTTYGTKMYRSDPDFFVEPQRTVKQAFEIKELFGTPPKKLEKFGVYWKTPSTTDQLEGYDAIFVWEENDINAAGYTIELADITDIYRYENGRAEIDKGGVGVQQWTEFSETDDLLVEVRQLAKARLPVTLDWQSTPQNNQSFPKWQSGFLLQGNTQLTVRLQSGHVYAARIRASNGTDSHSDWLYLGTATRPTDPVQPAGLTRFEAEATKGIFALTKIAYNLLGTMDMYTLIADRNTDWQVVGDTKVAGEELLQVAAYTPGTPIDLKYGFEGETVNASTGDQVLTTSGSMEIVKTWSGWQDTKTDALFGPVSNPSKVPAWTKADWTYSGYADLDLKPAGAGGSGFKVQTETAGTFDVIDEKTVGFSTPVPDGTTESKILNDLTQFTTGQTTPDVYRNAGNTRLVVVIGGSQRAPTPAFSLYVSVGGNDTVVKSLLKDMNGNPIEVVGIEAQIFDAGSDTVALKTAGGFTAAAGDVPAYVVFNDANNNSLAGLRSGSGYTLRVRTTTGQGYTVGTQFPLTILYANQAANATIP